MTHKFDLAGRTTRTRTALNTMEKVISNNRSCAWVIIRAFQITICFVVLGLSIFLLIASLNDNRTWYGYRGDVKLVVEGSFEKSDLGIFFPVFIVIGAASLSLLSSLISLITYCCHRLSIKLIVFWDFLMAVGWLISSVFTGVFISHQSGWSQRYWTMDLYKLNLVFGIITTLLFIASAALGIRLHQWSKRRANSLFGPINRPPSLYDSKEVYDTKGKSSYNIATGTPYKSYSAHITPPQSTYRPSSEWEPIGLDGKEAKY